MDDLRCGSAGIVRAVSIGPVCHRDPGPARRQRHHLPTTRLFLRLQVAMDRLKVITELLRIGLACLADLLKNIVHAQSPSSASNSSGVQIFPALAYFLVLNTSRYGTADRPSVSLKFLSFSLFTQMAYVFPGSSLTGSTQVRLSARYFGLPSTFGKLSLERRGPRPEAVLHVLAERDLGLGQLRVHFHSSRFGSRLHDHRGHGFESDIVGPPRSPDEATPTTVTRMTAIRFIVPLLDQAAELTQGESAYTHHQQACRILQAMEISRSGILVERIRACATRSLSWSGRKLPTLSQ